VDVDAIIWCFVDFVSKDLLDVGAELELINWCRSLSGVALQGGGHEALWEEEGRHPVGLWQALEEPLAEELDSRDQVWDPGAEWLERGVAYALPLSRHFVVEEPGGHILELHRHDYGSLNRLV